VAAVRAVHRGALRRPFFWKAPLLVAQLEAVAPSPANQSPMRPAISLDIVVCRFAT